MPSNYAAARAAPTPVCDEHGVYAFFEGGNVIAVDHEGKLQWNRSLTNDYGTFDNNHGLGSSPAQTRSVILVHVQHRGPSYLVALDKRTGETRWKVERPSASSWSSPVVLNQGQREQVLISSAGQAELYDAETGERLWKMEDLSGNTIPSPTVAGGHVLLAAALSEFEAATNAAGSNLCLQRDAANGFQVKWRAERALCDYASPVVCLQYVYYVNRTGVVYCLDWRLARNCIRIA